MDISSRPWAGAALAGSATAISGAAAALFSHQQFVLGAIALVLTCTFLGLAGAAIGATRRDEHD